MVHYFMALVATALASLLLTELVRRLAIKTSMLDMPNARSSHDRPKPRGGGISIVVCVLICLCVLAIAIPSERSTAIGMLVAGTLISIVGLIDDRFCLSVRLRLLCQIVAAGWLLLWFGGGASIHFLDGAGTLGAFVGVVLSALFIIWCMNSYNFMDGLDGFAGSQAIVASAAGGLILGYQQDFLLACTMVATAGASLGFLIWNWSPARIFMGDCGSVFLGFLFGAVVIAGSRHATMPLSAGLLLLVVFLVDATLTLLRRFIQGEAWYRPHRAHAYQLANQLGASHHQVALCGLVMFSGGGLLAFQATLWRELAPAMLISYGIVLAALWMLINVLSAGRSCVVDAIRGNHQCRRNEIAMATYLRFRTLCSRRTAWRSKMPSSNLFKEVTGVASDLGYTVSHDWLDGCGGGRCEVAGEKWILLDFNMSEMEQIREILLAIHDEVDALDTISPDLRLALDRTIVELKLNLKPPQSKAA